MNAAELASEVERTERRYVEGLVSPTIYCDVDGVLADFVGGVARSLHLPIDWQPKLWDIGTDPLVAHRKDEYKAAVGAPGWCENLPQYYGTQEQMLRLYAARRRFLFLTSPWPSETWCKERESWLAARYGAPREVIFEYNKHKFAREGCLENSDVGNILIDDSDGQCEAWQAAGGTAYTVARAWNQGHMDLREIVSRILAGVK
jgi:hypothetical protein